MEEDQVTCVRCNRFRTFLAPESLCREHWACWWVDATLDGANLSDSAYQKKLEFVLSVINNKIP